MAGVRRRMLLVAVPSLVVLLGVGAAHSMGGSVGVRAFERQDGAITAGTRGGISTASTDLIPRGCQQTPPTTGKSPASLPGVGGGRYGSADGKLWVLKDGPWRPGGIKVAWSKPAGSQLQVNGWRLDGVAPPLVAHVPDGYSGKFQSTILTFPTAGCWVVQATAATSSLHIVVQVDPGT